MPATWTIPLINVIPGQTITASLWLNEFENIDTNFIPAGMDDYSATDNEMRTATDPFPSGATSRPTSLQGEIERIRFQLNNITGETYWYEDPDVNISTFKTRFDAHTHDGTTNNGPQIGTAGIADNAITQAKMADNSIGTAEIFDDAITQAKLANNSVGTAEILDANVTLAKLAADSVDASKIAAGAVGNSELASGAVTDAKVTDVAASKITGQIGTSQIADLNVTTAKIADSNVTTGKIANAAVDENKLAASVAGNGLAGGAGTALSVNVDGSTLEIASDSLRVKDAGVTEAKLETAVVNKLGQNIGAVSIVSTSSNGNAVNFSGQGRLKMIGAEGGSVTYSITIDGNTIGSGLTLTTGQIAVVQAASPYIVGSSSAGVAPVELMFRTSLVVNKSGGAGNIVVLYERSA